MRRVAVEKCDTQFIDKHPVFILSRLFTIIFCLEFQIGSGGQSSFSLA